MHPPTLTPPNRFGLAQQLTNLNLVALREPATMDFGGKPNISSASVWLPGDRGFGVACLDAVYLVESSKGHHANCYRSGTSSAQHIYTGILRPSDSFR